MLLAASPWRRVSLTHPVHYTWVYVPPRKLREIKKSPWPQGLDRSLSIAIMKHPLSYLRKMVLKLTVLRIQDRDTGVVPALFGLLYGLVAGIDRRERNHRMRQEAENKEGEVCSDIPCLRELTEVL